MAKDRDPKIRLVLELSPHQPELLEGLNHWLQLGLISDQQVRALCQEHLSCKWIADGEPLTTDSSSAVSSATAINPFEAAREALSPEVSLASEFLPYADNSAPARPQPRRPQSGSPAELTSAGSIPLSEPNQQSASTQRPVSLWLDRLMSELSVVWLLGLGVFLVVLSSAVLAATQWARFSVVSQYLVLLAYTLAFWGIAVWSNRNEHLQLTSRTLQMVTLLLVPLNFWAMDGLGVWGSPGGGWVAGIAAVLLTLAALQVMRGQRTPGIQQANGLGLAYLHSGWGLAPVPMLAIYIGVLGSAAVTVVAQTTGIEPSQPGCPSGATARTEASTKILPAVTRWSTLAMFFALGLLLFRGLAVLPKPGWGQLGLAFGLYGTTWVWLGQRRLGQSREGGPGTASMPRGNAWMGRGLLWWGWLIAIDGFRVQAFGVSVLGLGLRLQALQKLGRRRDLLVAYAIAVQLAFVGWQLVPSTIRHSLMMPLSAWASAKGGYDVGLLGLSLFPYVVVMVALADRYLHQGQIKLGQCSDGVAMGSNILLTGISAFSHPVLVINLIASAMTALIGTWRRSPVRQWRILLSCGLTLAAIIATIDYCWPALDSTRWMGVIVGLIAALWLAWRWLPTAIEDRSTPGLPLAYRHAADIWGHLLAVGLLVFMSISLGFLYMESGEPQGGVVLAQIGFLLVLGLRYWGQLQSAVVYLAGWGIELLVAAALAWREPTALALAGPTLGLGAIALILSSWLNRSRPALTFPLYSLTLAYAFLALALRSTTATAWTGWLVVGAALILLEVGRRIQKGPLRWLALLGLSIGWYELVIYQLIQSDGDSPVNGVIILAGVAALIMAAYRLMASRLDRHLQLPQTDLIWAAHIHWFVASLLMLGVAIARLFTETNLAWVGLAVVSVLLVYALLQGRIGDQKDLKSAWVYAGLVELVGWFAILRFTLPVLQMLDHWWGAVACAIAIPVYWIPWSRQGWPQPPWRVMAVGVPLVITLLTQAIDHIPSLWILAGFYGWLAWHGRRVQVSYLSAGCMVWAIWVWLGQQNVQDALAFVLPLGLTLLYVAQVDPSLNQPEARETCHWLRLIATSAILLTALFSARWTGLPVGVMGLGAIAVGLFLRTRAFLYGGTVVFILNALNQLVLLNATYPFIKWVVGILVGIGLIWIAADFERRRDQWVMLTQNWMQDLDGWH